MASLEKQAMVTNVFYDMGFFDHAEGTPKMVKAPFDLILIQAADDGEFGNYVQPCSIGASEDWFANSLVGDRNHDRQGIGYISDTIVVMENACGDHAGQNNWRGCFQIGMI